MKPVVAVRIGEREVKILAWQWMIAGVNGDVVPVYLLDTALPENHPDDQHLTDYLYRRRTLLCQETVLGISG